MSCPSFPGCASSPVKITSIIGSAPIEDAYLIVEKAKPWPSKLKKVEGLISELSKVLKKHDGESVKLLATPEIPWLGLSAQPRALLLRWTGHQALCEVVEAEPQALHESLSRAPQGDALGIYLVCTHGSRDPCCGLLGVPVYRALENLNTRHVLQVSHLGGHRFAPVVAAFPEWRFFGHLAPNMCQSMDSALARGEAYLDAYRGNGRLSEPLQTAEAALWAEHGPALKRVRQVSGDKRQAGVQALLRDGTKILYQAEFGSVEYRGYKSCKDYGKGDESKLKLPILKSLSRSEQSS